MLLITALSTSWAIAVAEDGYELWLRYRPLTDPTRLTDYRARFSSVSVTRRSPTIDAALAELQRAFTGLIQKNLRITTSLNDNAILLTRIKDFPRLRSLFTEAEIEQLSDEGFLIADRTIDGKRTLLITATTDIGLLYGSFHLLRMLQTSAAVKGCHIISAPRLQLRMLDHWDNLNRYVERGYAGISIWNWHTLPDYRDERYVDYARANASIGINAVALTNVNANALVLSPDYLQKCAALAEILRPYGIKVYLTARFSAPMELGGLPTADPLNEEVRVWWKPKVEEIYQLIPDFGGFLVKANSEGQPGPQNYGRSHADGANMFADALLPYKGLVIWRAFVYSQQSDDRFKQAFDEFKPLDGKFHSNVLLQVKNGPIDFQPREPYSPLFGAMEKTPLILEFQLTQEYLGQGTHLVYEAPLFKEILSADTYAKGSGSTVSRVIGGKLHNHGMSGIAAVANIGNDRNWTGHPFGQANWYAFGRLAWNDSLESEAIAREWIIQTFGNNKMLVPGISAIMLRSYDAIVNYMTPLGLHHIMGNGHHYGPAPWSADLPRPDWNPVYYHRADSNGIGFDRTASGSNALAQYPAEVRRQYEDVTACDERYLLWFHHVSWQYRMQSGRILWDELCLSYQRGVDQVKTMQETWHFLQGTIDRERFHQVSMLLDIQLKEAKWWRNACLLYFQTFSRLPLPAEVEKADHSLDYYKSLHFPYAPGN